MLKLFCLKLLLVVELQANLQYSIDTTWNGQAVVHESVQLELVPEYDDHFVILIQAPYFNAPTPPEDTCQQGYPYDQLYNFEVVETFFLCEETVEYVELEFSPCGAHLILLLHPTRTDLVQYLPLDFSATVDLSTSTWTGRAVVPLAYLPENVNRFNAFAIHKATQEDVAAGIAWSDGNVYESLYPVENGQQPDFHNLEVFGKFSLEELPAQEGNRELWKFVKNSKLYYNLETTIQGNRTERPLQVWFEREADFGQSVTISFRQEKTENDLNLPKTCDTLFGSSDRHDNSPGVQIYFFSESGLNLQLILGYSAQAENMSHVSEVGFPSECVSASFLQGEYDLLDRRIGSNDEDFVYTENYLWINGKQIWDGNLKLSWDYLPPSIHKIQIINNDNEISPEVDTHDLVLFRMDAGSPMHKMDKAGLVYSSLIVDEVYNSELSSIWEDILSKKSRTIQTA